MRNERATMIGSCFGAGFDGIGATPLRTARALADRVSCVASDLRMSFGNRRATVMGRSKQVSSLDSTTMPDPTSPTMGEIEEKMADIQLRIVKQQKMIDGYKTIRMATKNPDVLRKTEADERDARKSLEYFRATLADLSQRRDSFVSQANAGQRPRQAGGQSGYNEYDRPLPSPPNDTQGGAAARARQYSNLGTHPTPLDSC